MAMMVAILLAISGPFGTFQAGGFGGRFFYWFVVLVISVLLALTLKWLVNRSLFDKSILLREAVTIVLMTVFFTPFLWMWTFKSFEGFATDPLPMTWMGQIVLVISAAVGFMVHAIPFMLKSSTHPLDIPTTPPRILKRLSSDFDGRILHLAVEDHKVQLITSTGTFELRMRFGDAVDEVSELEGCCTHRSHWVVLDEIESVERLNGRPSLRMSSGKTVPISRKHQPELEKLGVL